MKDDAIALVPEVIPSLEIPDHWDYRESVKTVKSFVYKAKNLTVELKRELYIARAILDSRGGDRYNKKPNVEFSTYGKTWGDYCNDIGVHRSTVHLWLSEKKTPHVSRATGENEWYTPPDIIEAATSVMGGIDCDPASSDKANEIVRAKVFYSAEDNGLDKTWGKRVWMNPPYCQPLVDKFSEAITTKYQAGEISQACILVNNATETEWFQRMLAICSSICFLTGRVKFINTEGEASGAPLQGQAIIYFGDNGKKFHGAFGGKGIVLDGPGKDTQ